MIKIEKHGYFFRRGSLRTECRCGCVYHTPKRKVCISIENYTEEPYFLTKCPECTRKNTQYLKDLERAKENNDERSNEDPDERTGAAHI